MSDRAKKQDKPKNRLGAWVLPGLSVAAVTAFPAVVLYCRNAAEAKFSEAAPFLLGSVAGGLLIYAGIALLTRKPGKAALVTSLFMLLMMNFSNVEKVMKLVLPELKYWHTVPIAVVVMLHIAYFLWRFLKESMARDISSVMCLVFSGLILLNVGTASPQILQRMQVQRQLAAEKEAAESAQAAAAEGQTSGQPNVYLLIFDEYANFPEMEEYYDYDNAPLKKFLEAHNFNISYTSHNESIQSATVQTNMVNLDYIVSDETSALERKTLRYNGVMYDLIRGHGYSVNILENGDFYGGSMPNSVGGNSSVATTIGGEDMEMLLCRKTVFYPLFQKSNTQIIEDYNIISNYIKTNAGEIHNTFTLAYFDLPHAPYVVDENGRELGTDAYAGPDVYTNKSYYLGQFKYTTKLMLSILEEIIEQDPQAVIVLMSDHGMRLLPGVPYEMKSNSLNALYYQGEIKEIEGLSNVNTLRTVMNWLFDLNYEMLEVPNQEEIG